MGFIKWVKNKVNKFKNSKIGRGLIKVGKGVGKGVKWLWKNGLKVANTINQTPLGGVLNGLTKGAWGIGVNTANTVDGIVGDVGKNVKGFIEGAKDLAKPDGDKAATITDMYNAGKGAAEGIGAIGDIGKQFVNRPAVLRPISGIRKPIPINKPVLTVNPRPAPVVKALIP